MEDIYIWHERQGKSPQEIVEEYPHPTLAGVYAAIAYYGANEELTQSQIKEGEKAEEEMRK